MPEGCDKIAGNCLARVPLQNNYLAIINYYLQASGGYFIYGNVETSIV
jgi:hypothetical protein